MRTKAWCGQRRSFVRKGFDDDRGGLGAPRTKAGCVQVDRRTWVAAADGVCPLRVATGGRGVRLIRGSVYVTSVSEEASAASDASGKHSRDKVGLAGRSVESVRVRRDVRASCTSQLDRLRTPLGQGGVSCDSLCTSVGGSEKRPSRPSPPAARGGHPVHHHARSRVVQCCGQALRGVDKVGARKPPDVMGAPASE